MKHFNNRVNRVITEKQIHAITQAAEILNEAFGREIIAASVNPDKNNPSEIFGVAFEFTREHKNTHHNQEEQK